MSEIPNQKEIAEVRNTFKAVSDHADSALKLLDSCVLARKEAETELTDLQDRLSIVLRERDEWKMRAESVERQMYATKGKKHAFAVVLHSIYNVFSLGLLIGVSLFMFALLAEYVN